jgi:hypothetical protein
MTYELWDLTTRNLTGFFATEGDALQAVRTAVEERGRSYAEAFALVREDARGRSTTIARGMELVERALAGDGRNRISA